MQKTSYQTPELRDENDSIIQEGSFGKNTALSNATNDGWIDYVMNNLEALHDTIGDSAPTLDGNGHVVEPANLAIGDEDGVRLKTGYVKTSGGTVNGTLNIAQNLKMQDNQENVFGGIYIPGTTATLQYLQLYGGKTPSSNGGNLQLLGNGQFTLQSKNGTTAYNLVGGTDGTLKWRGYELAWKKDYLPLAGGTMTGDIAFNSSEKWVKKSTADGSIVLASCPAYGQGGIISLFGKNHSTLGGVFLIVAHDGTNEKRLIGKPDGTLKWNGKELATQEFVNNKVKSVKLTSTFNFDFTGKNGWINQDTDGNNLHFTLPTGVTEVLAFSLISSGVWTSIVAWKVTNSSINFSLENHHPTASYSGTSTCYCYLLYR